MLPRIALLDTNLLLVWLIGIVDSTLLFSFKRVTTFSEDDVALLKKILKGFSSVITTPHVLTEVSNFIGQAPQHRRAQLRAALKAFVQECDEVYESSRILAGLEEFHALGLADAGLSSLSGRATVITVDYHLSGLIERKGGSVINFNHARQSELFAEEG